MHYDIITLIITIILSYLMGTIPTGLLLTKWFALGDIREVGSGNIGATNVLRTGNKWVAAGTLAFDMLKGLLPPVIVHFFVMGSDNLLTALSGLLAVIGHCYPIWLKFKGGKGVATGLGVFFAFDWRMTVIVAVVWLLVAKRSKISSLSALVAFTCAPFLTGLLDGFRSPYFVAVTLIVLLVWLRHQTNIKRLISGNEK